jgi:N6-adenosine-specific RNA methylase IME4
MIKFKTIYADPPWPEIGGGKIKRGADAHYPLMTVKEIGDLPVWKLAEENSHLYLWTTNNYFPSAIEVMRRWGFQYKTCITWVKDRIGLGQYFRGLTEHCLFGVKGVLPYKIIEGKRQQGRTAILSAKQEHSVKPEEMRVMIEKVSYPSRIELFARRRSPGWYSWGNDGTSNFLFEDGAWIELEDNGDITVIEKENGTPPACEAEAEIKAPVAEPESLFSDLDGGDNGI